MCTIACTTGGRATNAPTLSELTTVKPRFHQRRYNRFNSVASALVNVFDVAGIRDNARGSANPAPIDDKFDIHRNALVNVFHFAIARDNVTNSATALRLITVP